MSRHEAPVGKREPAVIIGLVVGFVTTVIALVVAFGVDLSTEQQGAILAVVAALAALVQAFLTRGVVFAPASVARIEDQAVATGVRIAKVAAAPGPSLTYQMDSTFDRDEAASVAEETERRLRLSRGTGPL